MIKVSCIHSSREVTDEQTKEIVSGIVGLYQDGKIESFKEVLEQAKAMCGVE